MNLTEPLKKEFRTDRHNNPIACTTDIARQAGLIEHKEYARGDFFNVGSMVFFTAKLLGDPIEAALRIINNLGFYTKGSAKRWDYIAIPGFIWTKLTKLQRIQVVFYMYQREGGTALIPNFEKVLGDAIKDA